MAFRRPGTTVVQFALYTGYARSYGRRRVAGARTRNSTGVDPTTIFPASSNRLAPSRCLVRDDAVLSAVEQCCTHAVRVCYGGRVTAVLRVKLASGGQVSPRSVSLTGSAHINQSNYWRQRTWKFTFWHPDKQV